MVTIQTGLDEDGNPVYAALKDTNVQLRKKGSSTIIETMTTDADGWYLSDYIHKGKTANYTLTLVCTAYTLGRPFKSRWTGTSSSGKATTSSRDFHSYCLTH